MNASGEFGDMLVCTTITSHGWFYYTLVNRVFGNYKDGSGKKNYFHDMKSSNGNNFSLVIKVPFGWIAVKYVRC